MKSGSEKPDASCPVCGDRVFHAIPHVTTAEEIVAFRHTAPRFASVPVAGLETSWIHPGAYCYSCSYESLAHYLSPAELRGPPAPQHVRITKPGEDRVRVLAEIRRHKALSLEECSLLFDDGRGIVVEFRAGDRLSAEEFVEHLKKLGATAEIVAEGVAGV